MKKVILVTLTFVLMISLFINVAFAEEVPEVAQTEEAQTENVSTDEKSTVRAKAKVIEIGEVTKKTTGNIEDTVQQIKIEILDGEYETKEFDTEEKKRILII